jgi:hypothetical protein
MNKNITYKEIADKINKSEHTVKQWKQRFPTLTGVPYQTIMNWKDKTPVWVDSWLDNYSKAELGNKVIEAVKPFVDNK